MASSYDDDNLFCQICKLITAQDMLLCSCCNSGNHTHCVGLPCIPEADCCCSEGCRQLAQLQVVSTIVIESPQPLYMDAGVPHLSQGLFSNIITKSGPVQLADAGAYRDITTMRNKAPVQNSRRMYNITHQHRQLMQLHWELVGLSWPNMCSSVGEWAMARSPPPGGLFM